LPKKYKIGLALFVACQLAGTVIPNFANVHSNPFPLIALLLLIPGVAMAFFLPHASDTTLVLVAIPINALVWFFAVRAWPSRGEESYWPGR
jgi:hypothetical protein